MRNIVVMGRETQESLPKKKLSDRFNVVLTHKDIDTDDTEVSYMHNITEAVAFCKEIESRRLVESFIIGGESIYKEFLPYYDTAYITKVHSTRKADKHFPIDILNHPEWRILHRSKMLHDKEEDVDYQFFTLSRVVDKNFGKIIKFNPGTIL
jgi:dihydrofolate reductase